jgi:DNA-binding transcriptional ArsR family regulator
MPVSKSKQFTIQEQEMALLGRALSHPARVRILSILN